MKNLTTTQSIVRLSRFTPNLKNAKDVGLMIGDKITAKSLTDKPKSDAIINSERVFHKTGQLGYICIFPDDKKRYFVPETQIINWEGKVD